MKYYEITITPNAGDIDAAADALTAEGLDAFEVVNEEMPEKGDWDYIDESLSEQTQGAPHIRIFLEDSDSYPLLLEEIRQAMSRFPDGADIRERLRDDSEWNNVWKRYFKPFWAGERIVICPNWETYTPKGDEIVVTIDPGAAFGSGLHETTQMCIAALERYVTDKKTVLDIGCGSGILAIAAAKLSAKSVLAADFDPVSVAVARENAAQNQTDITVLESDLLDAVPRQRFDIIVANIVADVVIRLSETVRGFLTKDGVLIASGIVSERLDEVLESFDRSGFHVLEIIKKGDWRAVVAAPEPI